MLHGARLPISLHFDSRHGGCSREYVSSCAVALAEAKYIWHWGEEAADMVKFQFVVWSRRLSMSIMDK